MNVSSDMIGYLKVCIVRITMYKFQYESFYNKKMLECLYWMIACLLSDMYVIKWKYVVSCQYTILFEINNILVGSLLHAPRIGSITSAHKALALQAPAREHPSTMHMWCLQVHCLPFMQKFHHAMQNDCKHTIARPKYTKQHTRTHTPLWNMQ